MTEGQRAVLADPGVVAVWDALPEARIVGGAVRDAIAGRAVADVDFATPLPPPAVVAALAAAGLKSAPTGIKHGTVTAIADHRGFEVTTLRSDVATDGRHAVVRFTDDWEADAARRDFTMNALSMRRDGTVDDYFDGLADLAAARVRFVGDARQRIAEDYLRVLRFFRFHARYGGGDPDRGTLEALREGVVGLGRLSVERVWSELKRILAGPRPDETIRLMCKVRVLAAVLPEAIAPAPSVPLGALPADPLLRLAALRSRDAEALATRLRLSLAERQRLIAYAGDALPEAASGDDIRRALADTAPDILIGRARLEARSAALLARIGAEKVPRFPLRGRDLAEAGEAPGPAMGERLRRLRQLWLDSGCALDRGALLAEDRRAADDH